MIRNTLSESGRDFRPGTSTSGSLYKCVRVGRYGVIRPAVVGRGMRTLSILVYKTGIREGGRKEGFMWLGEATRLQRGSVNTVGIPLV